LKRRLASILNASIENVDVFTILHSPHNPNITQLDVRFSAHGSPYYQPEKINAAIDKHQAEVRIYLYMRGEKGFVIRKLGFNGSFLYIL